MLTPEKLDAMCEEFQGEASSRWEEIGISQQDLRAVFDAVNVWSDANQASFNQAIPEPSRSAMSNAQKVRILFSVIREGVL